MMSKKVAEELLCNAFFEDIMQSATSFNVSSKCPTCGVAASWHKRKDVNEHRGRNKNLLSKLAYL